MTRASCGPGWRCASTTASQLLGAEFAKLHRALSKSRYLSTKRRGHRTGRLPGFTSQAVTHHQAYFHTGLRHTFYAFQILLIVDCGHTMSPDKFIDRKYQAGCDNLLTIVT